MRAVEPYDPSEDAATRHPGWRIELAHLFGLGEIVDRRLKLIVVDPGRAGPLRAVAHALSHIDLSHVDTGCSEFSAEQEDDADWLAELRLTSAWPTRSGEDDEPCT